MDPANVITAITAVIAALIGSNAFTHRITKSKAVQRLEEDSIAVANMAATIETMSASMQWLDTELRDTREDLAKTRTELRATQTQLAETTAQMNQLLADRSVCPTCRA